MDKRYTFADLKEIIARLRGDNGCPWDKAQTYQSLVPYLREETAELIAAIRIFTETGDAENFQEELGDVLLQILLHSQIAAEEGLFTVDDVVQTVSEKMIRRHPHVFGTASADTAEAVVTNWEAIKKQEKEGHGELGLISPLRAIPVELSALSRGQKVLKKISDRPELTETLEQSVENIGEQLNLLSKMHKNGESVNAKVEIGELLLSCVNIARIYGINAEQSLDDAIEGKIRKVDGEQGNDQTQI